MAEKEDVGETFPPSMKYTTLHLHRRLAVGQSTLQGQVSAPTLSGDITVSQYRGDKSERCHSRRAKAL